MDGDLPVFATSGVMAIGVLTAWLWDIASAMGKVGPWALQGREGLLPRKGREEGP